MGKERVIYMNGQRYSFKNTLKENAGLSVYNTGYEKCDSNHSWGPALRDHYLIHFVSSGQGVYIYENQSHALKAGDLFLITPSKLASYRADPVDPWEYCWVGFNGTDARRLVTMAGFSTEAPILHSTDPEQTSRLLMNVAESSGGGAADDAQMVGYLYLFLSHLIRLSGQKGVGNPHQEYVANALRFIQYNYANDISISDIAHYAGISRSQLYRAFLEDFGISPHAYLQRYRINEACSLLRNPNYSIVRLP